MARCVFCTNVMRHLFVAIGRVSVLVGYLSSLRRFLADAELNFVW